MPLIEPPQGQVTLVFTDVQGSTVLWDQAATAMREALALHDRILRDTLELAGGYEVKTEGDAFMVAFSDPVAATRWCMDAQIALNQAQWSSDIVAQPAASEVQSEDGHPVLRGLRVRMGLHMGAPECRPDPRGQMDYFGGMVNRAARVSAAGHGGQVLLSEAVWQAVQWAELGTSVDLGSHALKGLERHEKITQLLPSALDARQFPAIRTVDLKKTNLPRRMDSFVGRKDEIRDIATMFSQGSRLVTVLGAGGTGKTRLSQRVAAVHLDDYPGGAWFVDLTEARSLSGLLGAFGTALGIALTQADPVPQVGAALRARQKNLVVVDNVEQIVDFMPETLGAWLQQADETRFLVTSRTRLGLEGEQIYYLDPLPTAEATQLFEDRAAAVKPGFRITDTNRETVREIVERLDCVSLAIELAAARVRMLPPKKLLSRLSQRFKLLQGQRRDQSARQATLRGAIDWSWQLLKPWEQLALAQCSVFDGGFSLEAAEEVLDLSEWPDAPWPMDVVGTLVDHSLLRQFEPFDGEERFTLFRSVQQYCAEKLGEPGAVKGAGEASPTGPQAIVASHRRHGAFFARLGQVESPDLVQPTDAGLRRGALEMDNLISAIHRARDGGQAEVAGDCCEVLCQVAIRLGPIGTALEETAKVLEIPGLPPASQTLILIRRCRFQLELGHLEEARLSLDRATRLHPRDATDFLNLQMLMAQANVLELEGDLEGCRNKTRQALQLARTAGLTLDEGILMTNLAGALVSAGELVTARNMYRDSMALLVSLGAHRISRTAQLNLALADLKIGRLDEASTVFQTLATWKQHDCSPVNHMVALVNLGLCACLADEPREALGYLDQVETLNRVTQSQWVEVYVLGWQARSLHKLGQLDEARVLLEGALEILPGVGDSFAKVWTLSFHACLLRDQGQLDQAAQTIAEAERHAAGLGDPLMTGQARAIRGTIQHLRGDRVEALQSLEDAREVAQEMGVLSPSDLGRRIAELEAILGEDRTDL